MKLLQVWTSCSQAEPPGHRWK